MSSFYLQTLFLPTGTERSHFRPNHHIDSTRTLTETIFIYKSLFFHHLLPNLSYWIVALPSNHYQFRCRKFFNISSFSSEKRWLREEKATNERKNVKHNFSGSFMKFFGKLKLWGFFLGQGKLLMTSDDFWMIFSY